MLPESYTPTNNQGEGFRGNSGTYDWNLNAKAGYTPNDTDEYSLSFIRQDGKKGAPSHTTDGLPASAIGAGPIGACKISISCPTPRSAMLPM